MLPVDDFALVRVSLMILKLIMNYLSKLQLVLWKMLLDDCPPYSPILLVSHANVPYGFCFYCLLLNILFVTGKA